MPMGDPSKPASSKVRVMAEENRIAEIVLDDALGGRLRPEVEHDRAVAIQDLIDENSFRLIDGPVGPYRVELGVDGGRLLVRARPLASDESHHLRKLFRCDSHIDTHADRGNRYGKARPPQ
jgi:uncharacterized protein (UPF0262 family)